MACGSGVIIEMHSRATQALPVIFGKPPPLQTGSASGGRAIRCIQRPHLRSASQACGYGRLLSEGRQELL